MPTFIAQADARSIPLPDASVDAVIGSPFYQKQRTYGQTGIALGVREWARFMLDVTREALRVCRGPVIWIVDDPVRGHRLWPGVAYFEAMAFNAGLVEDRKCVWVSNKAPTRKGFFWSHSWESVLVFKNRAGPLPYFDWRATAAPSKFKRSGAWRQRRKSGERPDDGRGAYTHPELANPRDVFYANVGGGHMAPTKAEDRLACRNHAPFPENLIRQILPVVVPPGGSVLDPFGGSGTTAAVAHKMGRVGYSFDIQASQCYLAGLRIRAIQGDLFNGKAAAGG